MGSTKLRVRNLGIHFESVTETHNAITDVEGADAQKPYGKTNNPVCADRYTVNDNGESVGFAYIHRDKLSLIKACKTKFHHMRPVIFNFAMPSGAEWLLVLFALVLFTYWIKTILEIVVQQFDSDFIKFGWLFIVVCLGIIGALIYSFYGKPHKLRKDNQIVYP